MQQVVAGGRSGQSESDGQTCQDAEPAAARLLAEVGSTLGPGLVEASRAALADRRIRVARLISGDHVLVRTCASLRGGHAGRVKSGERCWDLNPRRSAKLHCTVQLAVKAAQSTCLRRMYSVDS
jgi:hypothetical protein